MKYCIMFKDPNDDDLWSCVWDDAKMLVFENENQALNRAIDEAKENPGVEFFVMETIKSVSVPVGEPQVKKIYHGVTELGV